MHALSANCQAQSLGPQTLLTSLESYHMLQVLIPQWGPSS